MSFLPASRSACVGQNREMEVTTLEFIRVTSTAGSFLFFCTTVPGNAQHDRQSDMEGKSERNEKGRY